MIDLADDDLAKIQTVAMEAARHVSDFILASFRADRLIQDEKSDGSPVTQIDREAEMRVRNFIGSSALNKWPIVGEEFGGATEGARFRWLIDPIDGTFSYIRGLPTFGTIVAFEDVVAGRALVGAIHLPALHETYVAARGRGAWCNGTQIRVATDRNFKACLISTADADQFRRADLETEYRVLRSRVQHVATLTAGLIAWSREAVSMRWSSRICTDGISRRRKFSSRKRVVVASPECAKQGAVSMTACLARLPPLNSSRRCLASRATQDLHHCEPGCAASLVDGRRESASSANTAPLASMSAPTR